MPTPRRWVKTAPTVTAAQRRSYDHRLRPYLVPRDPSSGPSASTPNEIWHIDASKVRLLDGTVAWIHGIIDNASRRVLAWSVGTTCRAAATDELLRIAVRLLSAHVPPVTVITDGGSENVTSEDDDFATRPSAESDHNSLIPRVALGGRTPEEVFFGREDDVTAKRAEAGARARAERLLVNRATLSCGGCNGPSVAPRREEVVDGR